MLPSLLYILTRRLLELVALRFRSPRSKDLEIVVLRHELSILRRQVARPDLSDADRVFLAAASRILPRRRWSDFLVTPETLLRWHRRTRSASRPWTEHQAEAAPVAGEQLSNLRERGQRLDRGPDPRPCVGGQAACLDEFGQILSRTLRDDDSRHRLELIERDDAAGLHVGEAFLGPLHAPGIASRIAVIVVASVSTWSIAVESSERAIVPG